MTRIDRSASEVATTQFGLVTRAQLLAYGASPQQISHRLAVGRLVVSHRGVYRLAGAPESWEQHVLAAQLATEHCAVVSHRAAGRLWGLEGIESAFPELTIPHERRLRLRGVLVHRASEFAEDDLARRRPFVVTTPLRTLIDLAGVVSPVRFEDALDDALRRRLVALPMLWTRLESVRGKGVRGIGTVRRAVAERTPGEIAGSRKERELRGLLVAATGRQPRGQFRVRNAEGREVRSG